MTEHRIATTVMRGGTSKGVFVDAADLPPPGPDRDRFLLALLGSPDPMQLDGLGGTHSSTSKVVAVGPSDAERCDVDYLFAQVAIDEPVVDYAGNCGNLTTAVGPYAVDNGLVPAADGPEVSLVLRNLNTGVRIRTVVPLDGGRAAVEGELAIAGVPGTGPAIVTDYLDPGGSVLGAVLPTGHPVDRVTLADGTTIEASIVDITSPHAFVRASDVDLTDLAHLEAVRSACGALVGLDSRAVPRLAVVGPPGHADGDADLVGRATSMQRLHHAFPMTGALCTGAAARLAGTVVAEMCQPAAAGGGPATVRLRHPKGVVDIRVDVEGTTVRSVGVTRTARRLLRGEAYVVLR
ncbi:MAG: PrpF domain-containing protein [Acidimicrobiales bacterium]